MLQQMRSLAAREVAAARVFVDASSGASSDAADDVDLPQCKIRRNYNCGKCNFFTQNPRAYLVHTRDIHFEKFKIYDCPNCVYASRHHQKLIRHMKMVHAPGNNTASTSKTEMEPPAEAVTEPERIEDMLEEVEDTADMEEEDNDDLLIERVDVDPENNRSAAADESATAPDGRKQKFFSCNKCNYVTHIRSRFTKHVKYHSMPMIKCTMCDFRTPYKWNLDRHMKNHGGSGSFHCSMCNFTADIKQSLTVHEMNHHTPPSGHSASVRRRNRVGASELTLSDEAAHALITKEEEGSGDSRSSHSATDMGVHEADIEMISCNSGSNDATALDAPAKSDDSQDLSTNQSANMSSDETRSNKQPKKRPIPQLIPLNASTPNQKAPTSEPPLKKIKDMITSVNVKTEPVKLENLPADISVTPVNTTAVTKETPIRKKNNSFFDKLKERLLTETGENGSLVCKNCGFESKCLSEHSVHEKNCSSQTNKVVPNNIPSLGSTRCQNCRHRCKSSADLYIHMQTCGKSVKTEPAAENIKQETEEPSTSSGDQPHPMENVVFVWNNFDQNATKYEQPLDININDDSTQPEHNRTFDPETADENEGMNLSPSQAVGKKVFKCPHCPFWASTASRFHVHIVGHLNKKPFECSLCKYKSNWRWDITKHIKLKSARDPEHNSAKVLMTDETGRRNYSKYNKFLAMPILNEAGENEFHYIDQDSANADFSMDVDDSMNDTNDGANASADVPLDLHTQNNADNTQEAKKPKRTLWKCKKCNYKDPSKEALLEHVREHSRAPDEEPRPKRPEPKDPGDLAYRCGHCNQLSNWKHVIQRHCRLKHDGVIKVIAIEKPKQDQINVTFTEMVTQDFCTKCPFKTNEKGKLAVHMQQHTPSPLSIFKCYFCPYFVKSEGELYEHLVLHGITDPEEYISKAMDGKCLEQQPLSTAKRHRCSDCPYETNSKSQYMYHEQFHRLPADTPYKCQECNYSVSKRHLLHQHMRVHGIFPKKDGESETDASTSVIDETINLDEIPYVWVAAKNEFHKMFKCRYCSYVNSQKCKIPNHEKLHTLVFENSELTVHKCLECKFTCDNAFRLADHSKKHGELYGRVYGPVDPDVPDEEQIAHLRSLIEEEKNAIRESLDNDDPISKDIEEGKILYFCQKCPSRFFSESELNVHDEFHDLTYPNKCKSCEFSVPTENQLTSHIFIHTDEYRTKTKMLRMVHSSHPEHQEPLMELQHSPSSSEITWVVSPISREAFQKKCDPGHNNIPEIKQPKQYCCKECPAKFFKTSTLNYHMGLHGGDGENKCKKCSYAVKNIGHLAKHELLHETEGKAPACDYESGEDVDYKNIPLSGTDLFQRKTEAQKRVLIDKDKLVRPNDHFPPVLQADPQFGYLMHGNPEFIYPTYLKNGRQKEKRYKCHKCPSAFEKREQYKIHLSLHGSKQRYKCELCDYSVKYYANYVQHMRKHQMNDEAQAERRKGNGDFAETVTTQDIPHDDGGDNIKLAIKTIPKSVPKSDFQQFSVSDQQTLRLLQRWRSNNNTIKEETVPEPPPAKDRKLHLCVLCPYTNQRQDALHNHYKRHDKDDVLNAGYQKCTFCDLVVVQSHFLRDHIKSHFAYQKNLTPQCFVANEDVSFTVTDIDEEDSPTTSLTLETKYADKCNDEKIFVKISTGEIAVE
ncbi:zinc finger protein 91 isoform X2 [Plutella xylostella]|nr:zinc finger protein 91 isoform X2 [Plutella xylostella]